MLNNKKNPLLDTEFLNQLLTHNQRETFARITALTLDEKPIEYIEGKVTGGSINVDGTSAVRRTCNLTMIAKEVNINDFYWGLNNKFKLEIGLKNIFNPIYPDIIWFKQGTYVITTFNTSFTINAYNISISGKDKMCLLNGDIAGALPHVTDFGVEETYDSTTGVTTYTNIPIKTIIREAVQNFGNELARNIIINDLEDAGLELLEYRGDQPLYLFRSTDLTGKSGDQVLNMTINQNQTCHIVDNNGVITNSTTIDDKNIIYDNLVDLDGEQGATVVKLNKDSSSYYTIIKVEYGTIPGYRLTDLTFAGDLICNVGETITSLLDKIKNMLGEFEYFYDVEGRFVFQKKSNYIDTPWNSIVDTEDETYVEAAINRDCPIFSFTDATLITAFQNTPNLLNLRNDYSVWGKKKTTSGAELDIHMRYAIDKKPEYYKSKDNIIYVTDLKTFEELRQQKKNEIIYEIQTKLDNFTMNYLNEIPSGLSLPIKQSDGSWSAGWWDIRDWYEYYKLIKREEPRGTMKWYSKGNSETTQRDGYVYIKDLPKDILTSDYQNNTTGAVWLIIIDPRTGLANLQHGSGNPEGSSRLCYYYESILLDDGKVSTTESSPQITQYFSPPYSGCSDTHTYLEFLKEDIEKDKNNVYFYNPAFLGIDSFKELIETEVNKEFDEYIKSGTLKLVDWREIIYQMAIDYRKYYHDDDFLLDIAKNNESYYPEGRTGYEQYYVDMEGFWRLLYDPNPTAQYKSIEQEEAISLDENILYLNTFKPVDKKDTDWEKSYIYREDLKGFYPFIYGACYLKENTKYHYYASNGTIISTDVKATLNRPGLSIESLYIDNQGKTLFVEDCFNKYDGQLFVLDDEYRVAYNSLSESLKSVYKFRPKKLYQYYIDKFGEVSREGEPVKSYPVYYYEEFINFHNNLDTGNYWSKTITDNPESLLFWFDFLEGEFSDLNQYSVGAVGARTKAINDSNVKSIYYREIPTTIFKMGEDGYEPKTGYTYIQLQNTMANLFTISSKGKSAKERIDELLYEHSYCIESVTITAVPVYHLIPNTRILVHDDNSKINGEYIVSKITIPLTHNGTMSITATKAVSNIA